MNIFYKMAVTAALVFAGGAAQADRKEDEFHIFLDSALDNPVLQGDLQAPLMEMLLADAYKRGLGLADTLVLHADRGVASWNDKLLTSRDLPPERLGVVLSEKLAEVPEGLETSRLMRLMQTSRIDCSAAATVTVYVLTNLVSAISLNPENGASLKAAPSISLNECALVWVGPTLGSPELSLREVQHIDDLITKLNAHLEADDHDVLR